MTSLLDPVTLGAFSLRNRIVMAPLTRSRATGADGRTPNALMR
ncbi:MAG: alkene reductase, partial [Deltaproteobacteria bacterium]|nr:alkene reductase [Nannocystaceae bacterium]